MDITSLGTTIQTAGGFFAGFNNTAAASGNTPVVVGTKLYLRLATGGFNIGLSKASSTASDIIWDSGVYTANSTLFIVGSYDYGTFAGTTDDSSRLWINPNMADFGALTAPSATLTATGGTDLATAGLGIQSFVLMQRGNTLQPTQMLVDELRIGSSWAEATSVPEPTSAALVIGGLLALVATRRSARR